MFDYEIFNLIDKEFARQDENIELIASENFVSPEVRKAQGSILTNKYAEGYPGKRYYGGCRYVDKIENIAKERAQKLFSVRFSNVQPHSGSQANQAVYRALLKPGDKILGMSLSSGGHLTHGYHLSFSGQDYEAYSYGLNKATELIDYDELEKLALKIKPKMIVAGASSYPRIIDCQRIREIADKVNAYFFFDMAHVAGLVASGLHPNPCLYADVVSSTTHKTLRGPRGGIILTNSEDIAKKIDKAVFPNLQGGPLMHVIAAKAVCFYEAMSEDFVEYQKRVIANARCLADRLAMLGYRIITGGTDNHIVLVDVYNSIGVSGIEAQNMLEEVNITCNKNAVMNDTLPPFKSSGIRLGTSAMTTRGFQEADFVFTAHLIDDRLRQKRTIDEIKKDVAILTKKYPLEGGK